VLYLESPEQGRGWGKFEVGSSKFEGGELFGGGSCSRLPVCFVVVQVGMSVTGRTGERFAHSERTVHLVDFAFLMAGA
jgi:hypothetical protein